MSNDQFHYKRCKMREKRKKDVLLQKKNKWLIVCEGEKTEPNYFERAIFEINKNIPEEYQIDITIKGEGKNTTSLVKTAEELQTVVDKYIKTARPYGKVFVVFDKDDFTDDSFNSAIEMCDRNGFIPLWSNQAIEFWFLLHFNYVDTGMNRKDYQDKINEAFKNKGFDYKYKKNDKDIYDYLINYGSLEAARKSAMKLIKIHCNDSPAKSESCTTVNKFFDVIDERLDELK